jgi:putative ABC transport system ATP-binding protein
MELLCGLNRERGISIAMVTHEPDMARYAKRTIVFRDGLVHSDLSTVAEAGAAI